MSLRVLIADSDKYLLDHYREHLERNSFEVAVATNGLDCVQMLREFSPDILVLEPSIPWGNGDGILARMHEESDIPLIPVIAITYGRDRATLYRLAPFKVDDYQIKPFSAAKLLQRIRSILASRRIQDPPIYAGSERLGGVR